MKNQISERHHYLPEFFLKEFANAEGFLHVFDKTSNEIHPKKKSPKSIFFEWKRNTSKLGDNEYVWLEDIYQNLDSSFSQIYKKILAYDYSNLTEREQISRILDILIIINFIRWRVPARDFITHNLYEKHRIADLSLKIVDKNGLVVQDSEFEKFLLSLDFFRKGQSSMIISEPFYNFEQIKETSDKMQFFTQDNHETLICDNPYIEEVMSKDIQSFSEFLFPFSKKHLAIYVKNFNNKPLDSNFCYLFELVKFEQAQKYVASSNLEILKFYSAEYKKMRHENISKLLFEYIKTE